MELTKEQQDIIDQAARVHAKQDFGKNVGAIDTRKYGSFVDGAEWALNNADLLHGVIGEAMEWIRLRYESLSNNWVDKRNNIYTTAELVTIFLNKDKQKENELPKTTL